MDLTKEANVKKEIKKILDKHEVFYFMPSASMYGKAGIPDFVCCVNGYFFAIEAKNSKVKEKGLKPLQIRIGKKIKENNGFFKVVYNEWSLEELNCNIGILLDSTVSKDYKVNTNFW